MGRNMTSCILITVFLMLKATPWMVGSILAICRRMNLRYFAPAAPRIGFLLTLSALTFEMWRQYAWGVQNPFCLNNTIHLSHLNWDIARVTIIHLIVIGLSAWAVSVAWSFLIRIADLLAEN